MVKTSHSARCKGSCVGFGTQDCPVPTASLLRSSPMTPSFLESPEADDSSRAAYMLTPVLFALHSHGEEGLTFSTLPGSITSAGTDLVNAPCTKGQAQIRCEASLGT